MQLDFTLDDILGFEQRYRATFINSLGGFKSLALIGTCNSDGLTNLAVFNSLFHLGAHPPLIGFIVRPDSVDRHTLSNILETQEFTVNQVQEGFYMQAHQTSARYAREVSEFAATGLHEEFRSGYRAPFVRESVVKYGVRLVGKKEIEINGTILIIGEIQMVSLPEACLAGDGFIDLQKAGTITCTGLDAYYSPSMIGRLSYAKPGKDPELL